ncbi:hypothetical protein QZH41_014751, partial [Actinostola sp. cb2023]
MSANNTLAEIIRSGNGTVNYKLSLTTISSQLFILGLLFLIAVTGNSTIIILMKRFQSLRTISNMMLANMAIVDNFNILANLPWFVLVGVLEMNDVVRGRLMSALIATSQVLLNNLKLLSMIAMICERYLALSLGLRYSVWKNKQKVAMFLILVWIIAFAITVPWFLSIYKIDIGDAPTFEYRIAYFQQVGKTASFFLFLFSGIAITVISVSTCMSFKKQMKRFQSWGETGQGLQERRLRKARTKTEARAAFTIGLTIAVYVLCYLPVILFSVFVGDNSEITKTSQAKWFGFVANFFLFFSSACNPFIYILRSGKFRFAIVHFMKSPCGVDDIG